MVDPVQQVFFGHLRIREIYSHLLLSDHDPDNQDDRDDRCHYLQSWAHTSYPPTPHLGAFMMMINKNNCFVIGAIITILP